jgi:chromosomal replication initiator protein
VVDYLNEIPLRGRTFAAPTSAASALAGDFVMPSFVAGPENRLVAATVDRLLQQANRISARSKTNGFAQQYLPHVLALFGPHGVGKTHLARGLVRHWQTELGDDAAEYMTASDFRRQLTAAISDNTVVDFRRQLRARKLMALDDLHQLPSDEYLMQELRGTLDAFEESGGFVVVTSLRPAETLGNLPPDVRSRLVSGLSLQLALPGNAARMRIIRHASTALGRTLSDQDSLRMADVTPGTAGDLFGTLFASLAEAPQPQQTSAARAGRQPELSEIIRVVARYCEVPQKQLKSGSRKQSVVFARAVAIYLARQLAGASYQEIGRSLGGRDHTTIMHSYRKIERDREQNFVIQETLDDLRRLLLAR